MKPGLPVLQNCPKENRFLFCEINQRGRIGVSIIISVRLGCQLPTLKCSVQWKNQLVFILQNQSPM